MTPNDWIRQFLEREGRVFPADGRPLYAYRVTEQEYDSLIETLKQASIFGVESLATSPCTKWPMAFVLFAAEWWRREYSGGAWSWEEIFSAISLNRDDLPVTKRNQAVEGGLRDWLREVRTNDYHREFLASIAMEGGLPLQRLQSQGNGHRELLKIIIRELPNKQRLGFTAADIAKLSAHRLPLSFQRDEVYFILGSIAEACIELRDAHDLSSKTEPFAWLHDNAPNWQQKFPLSLSDQGADILLKALIEEAVSHQGNEASDLKIRRYLDGTPEGFRLKAELLLPDMKVKADVLSRLIGKHAPDELAPRIIFNISVASQSKIVARLRIMAGTNSYRVRKQSAKFTDSNAAAEIRLRLEDGMNAEICTLAPPSGGELVPELPWVFSDNNESGPYDLLSQGRARIKEQTCIIAVPTDLKIDDSDGVCEPIGSLVDFDRHLFRVLGSVKLELDAGPVWIKTEQCQTEAAEYEIVGKTLAWESKPNLLFLGFPSVFEHKIGGVIRKLPPHKILWRWFGEGNGWHREQAVSAVGVIELAGIDNETEELLFRRKIGLLPKATSIHFRPGESALEGEIELSDIGQQSAFIQLDGMDYQVKSEGNSARLFLKSGTAHPPADVSVDIEWPGRRAALNLKLPFPAKGAHVFDGEKPHDKNHALYLNSLHGTHVRIFNQSDWHHTNIRVHAYHSDDKNNIYFIHNRPAIEKYGEVRLIEYKGEISRLFAASDKLDGTVILKIEGESGQVWVQLKIQQYQCYLFRNQTDGFIHIDDAAQKYLTIDDLEGMQVSAVSLAHPERNPTLLEARRTEGVPTGQWAFLPEKRIASTWLIYPGPDSRVKFRPISWENNLAEVEMNGDNLSAGCLIQDQRNRILVFDEQINQMSRDSRHEGWRFLQQTLDRLGHLPLSTHDLVRRIVRNADAMAGLFFLIQLEDIDRFAQELPFSWGNIPYASWRNGMNLFTNKYREELPDELIRELLHDKLEVLSSIAQSLEIGLHYLKTSSDNEAERVIPGSFFLDSLFNGANSEVQKLTRDAADMTWPTQFFDSIPHWINLMPNEYKKLVDDALSYCDTRECNYRRSVIFLPIFLGIEWVTGTKTIVPDPGESEQLFQFKICQLQNFHRDWFDNAMKWTIGYGLNFKNWGQ